MEICLEKHQQKYGNLSQHLGLHCVTILCHNLVSPNLVKYRNIKSELSELDCILLSRGF